MFPQPPPECGSPSLQELGYQHGKTLFDVWQRSGVVDSMLKDRRQEEFHRTRSGHVSADAKSVQTLKYTNPNCACIFKSMHTLTYAKYIP